MNLFITWDVTPELIEGWKTPNLYGLLFVTGLLIGYFVIKRMFKKDGVHEDYLDKLVLYMVLATIIGARLGHVIFYGPYTGPDGYFSNPLNILKVWEGGLASHGGGIAILIALYFYSKKVVKMPMMWILDRIVVTVAVAGCFIRLGNLMNSEIVGIETNVPWAFQFVHYFNSETLQLDPSPRHPAQLYEAICYIISFVILMVMYWKRQAYRRPGLIFGTFLILIWGARFTIEFVKLGQTDRDAYMPINTGQMLSVPFFLAGVYILYKALKSEPRDADVGHLKVSTSLKDK
ncbi:MAG: prolipoprotein diacylglyceryl transferase [Crocinitomicaceae bacterium]|nr:prolipoprotein diacylglyceryl transferase [Crocinitomicaceae bacterium]